MKAYHQFRFIAYCMNFEHTMIMSVFVDVSDCQMAKYTSTITNRSISFFPLIVELSKQIQAVSTSEFVRVAATIGKL